MKSSMRFSGLDTYIEELQKAGKDIDLVSRDALHEIAEELQTTMFSKCPTNDLLPYIRIRTPSGEGHFNYVNVGILYDADLTPADVMRKAIAIEFGHIAVNGTHVSAMPFIRPSISTMKSRALGIAKMHLSAAQLIDP
jgi:hypothetical protein